MSTGQAAVAVLCGREGNCRSVVTLAIVTDCMIYPLGVSGLRKGDEHSDYTFPTSMAPFTFLHSIK